MTASRKTYLIFRSTFDNYFQFLLRHGIYEKFINIRILYINNFYVTHFNWSIYRIWSIDRLSVTLSGISHIIWNLTCLSVTWNITWLFDYLASLNENWMRIMRVRASKLGVRIADQFVSLLGQSQNKIRATYIPNIRALG